ncbi:MAG: helix-turn-helix domain-containing protein [Pedobacter sp.]|uniref:helix-turn-helix domain-containing protein n=1 Tax=Pedobacter sp. TaxID=1411316 RepID=UPI002807474A|nr:helix-turn-helix domain-containing protein [Pedobacter sp.]MDQ8006497.1 helix-turn-helix domain-containing protein [Pedobacter sp.]
MASINTEIEYKAIKERIEELLLLTDDDTHITDKKMVELDKLSELVEEYEDIHHPIGMPTLAQVIKLRMYEMGLSQNALSELVGVSPSRISEYLTEKSEPTLKVARSISKKLKISADIILGI